MRDQSRWRPTTEKTWTNGIATGTMNWDTFTEQAFAFAITSDVIIQAVTFSTVVGVAAGVLPAWRATRVDPCVSLKYE